MSFEEEKNLKKITKTLAEDTTDDTDNCQLTTNISLLYTASCLLSACFCQPIIVSCTLSLVYCHIYNLSSCLLPSASQLYTVKCILSRKNCHLFVFQQTIKKTSLHLLSAVSADITSAVGTKPHFFFKVTFCGSPVLILMLTKNKKIKIKIKNAEKSHSMFKQL